MKRSNSGSAVSKAKLFPSSTMWAHLSPDELFPIYIAEKDDITRLDIRNTILSQLERLLIQQAVAHMRKSMFQKLHVQLQELVNESVIGAIECLDEFDPERIGFHGRRTKLSSYVAFMVHCWLRKYAERAIECRCKHTNLMSLRSYLQHLYDSYPERKLEFERKQGWILPDGTLDEAAVDKARSESVLLINPELLSLDGLVESPAVRETMYDPDTLHMVDEVIQKVTVDQLIEKLPDCYRIVVAEYRAGYGPRDIAKHTGLRERQIQNIRHRLQSILAPVRE